MKTRKGGMQQKPRTATRLKTRLVYAAAFAFFLVAGGIFITLNFTQNTETKGASLGDYKSVTDGNWNSTSTWQYYNGATWIAAVSTPTASAGAISISAGDTVRVTANVSADQIDVNADGCLQVNTGTLTIANGTGTDLTVNGNLNITSTLTFGSSSTSSINGTETLNSTGTINIGSSAKQTINSNGRLVRKGGTMPTATSSSLTVSSGGTFEHNMDGGTVPAATWSTGSTCEITGIVSSVPAGITQSFSNLTWNCASQNTEINLNGTLTTVNGNFSFQNSGTGNVVLDKQGNSVSFNIGGNMSVSGGMLFGCMNGAATVNVGGDYNQTGGNVSLSKAGGTAYGNTSTGIYVTGNAVISGGTLDMSQCSANNPVKGMGLFYVKKNLTFSGTSSITITSAQSRGQIHFNGTTEQLYIAGDNVTGKVDFVVDALAILRLDQQVIKSSGNFLLNATGGLMVGDQDGITLTAAAGNVQVTGTRTYTSGSDITYNGTGAQSTGDGIPSLCRNLTFNNASTVTMAASSMASGTLSFLAGLVVTNSNYVGMGSSIFVLGTLNKVSGHVVGNFRRWFASATVSNVVFPVGSVSNYNPIVFNMTTAPVGGTITCAFVPSEARLEGLPLTDAGDEITTVSDCYWSATAADAFSGGTYTVNVYGTGVGGINDYTLLHLLRREGTGSLWTAPGTHITATGSNAAPVVNRGGLNVLGQFAFGSTNTNPLPIELLYFRAKAVGSRVEFTWATSAEKDNDYFSVERSSDGRNFTEILRQKGAGNSRIVLNYSDADNEPMPSNYYRLKQTDFDGQFSYSPIVMVRFDKQVTDSKLKMESVSPNPFRDNFRMQFTSAEETEGEMILMNLSGQTLKREKVSITEGLNNYEYNDGVSLKAGTYIVVILTRDSKISEKIIRN